MATVGWLCKHIKSLVLIGLQVRFFFFPGLNLLAAWASRFIWEVWPCSL